MKDQFESYQFKGEVNPFGAFGLAKVVLLNLFTTKTTSKNIESKINYIRQGKFFAMTIDMLGYDLERTRTLCESNVRKSLKVVPNTLLGEK